MRLTDVIFRNLRRRVGRKLLLVTGLAIGVATVVALVAITATMQADVSTKLDEYGANLEAIFERIQQLTGTTLIWASTTPVNEDWHHKNKPFDRFEADVRAYNQKAAEIAVQFGIPINDLYQVVMDAGRDEYLIPDGVHLSPKGYTLLGNAVADFICTLL